MGSSQFQLKLGRNQSAHLHVWAPAQGARGCVQIVHGMAEHGGRYARVGAALAKAGYAVYAQDLPGHGRTVRSADELGHVDDFDGWKIALSAINQVRAEIERRHPETPLFVLGHSRGSFLTQNYIVEHGHGLAGAILSASCADMGPMRAVGLALLRGEALWMGRRQRSALADTLTFKDFNRRFKPNRTPFDWLSRDQAEVDRYVQDPLCGFRCSTALWIELMEAGALLTDAQRLARIPKSLPMLLINGSKDPACRGERGARGLEKTYRNAKLSDVTLKLYPDARHELLNETCRDTVTADVQQWLDARCASLRT